MKNILLILSLIFLSTGLIAQDLSRETRDSTSRKTVIKDNQISFELSTTHNNRTSTTILEENGSVSFERTVTESKEQPIHLYQMKEHPMGMPKSKSQEDEN